MRWLLRNIKTGVTHSAVQEGGGTIVLMMTACGLSVRWDEPHAPWQRAQYDHVAHEQFRRQVTCRRCKA